MKNTFFGQFWDEFNNYDAVFCPLLQQKSHSEFSTALIHTSHWFLLHRNGG